MNRGYAAMRFMIKAYPLGLNSLDDKLKRVADRMMPYSVGIEIEAHIKEDYSLSSYIEVFKTIPNLLEIDIDYEEQRFRIPKGMICLYEICERLPKVGLLNPGSGLHYHIDFTDISPTGFFLLLKENEGKKSFILNSLKSWNYIGSFNDWEVDSNKSVAVRFHSIYQTLEFRIGEMTFDYELMIKRILHCQNICKKLKDGSR